MNQRRSHRLPCARRLLGPIQRAAPSKNPGPSTHPPLAVIQRSAATKDLSSITASPSREPSLQKVIPQPIQNMPPHRMPFRHARMIKILLRIPRHPQFLHHSPRPHIRRHRKRNQLRQLQNLKRVSRNRPRSLRRQPASPIFRRQPPPNLHARCKRRLKLRHPNPDKSNKRSIRAQFRRAQTKMVPLEMFRDAVHRLVALLPREQRRHEFHHPRIRIHPRKRRTIRIAPPPQTQPVCIKNHPESPPPKSNTEAHPRIPSLPVPAPHLATTQPRVPLLRFALLSQSRSSTDSSPARTPPFRVPHFLRFSFQQRVRV
jgi:hypothetical protein